MFKVHKEIDFEIIWRKINGSLTDVEEAQLLNWLNEDSAHMEYLKQTTDYYTNGSGFRNIDVEKSKIWDELKKTRLKDGRQPMRRFYSYVAVAASIIMIVAYIEFSETVRMLPLLAGKKEMIHPGTNQATLILDDGSTYNLSSTKKLVLKEGGSVIKSEGTKLDYTEEKEISKEIKYNTLSIPRGGEFFLQLSDGTKVWLNSETVLRYPVQFSGKERKVELTGEAFFEVTRNEKVPFLVESGEQVVKVLGTEFNISSYQENQSIYTTLVKGSVETYLTNHPEESQNLKPNEQSVLTKSVYRISKRKVDPLQYVAWKEGRFVFEDQDLQDIMVTLSRWYNIDVVFEREDLRNIHFTGNLQRYSDFGAILSKIQLTDEVEFVIDNRKVTIR